ncbi:hypothetical protein [Roseovarius sp. SYSU LYC5161]|uniref:hypothetical protein n=1 Tax=Roseovarius halophilus (ex Wu et al. 2025) TaxID=3376060 RepID=UPI00399A97DC
MKWLWRGLGVLRRGLVLVVLLVMLAFNVASFAVEGLNGVMSGVAEAVVGHSVVAELKADKKKLIDKMDNATRRIARRAIRGVGRNVAALPMEVIPVAGAATVVAVTAIDVKQACATARDMQELRTGSGIDTEPKDWTAQVCGVFTSPAVPAVCDMTIDECRDHASEVRADLGDDMGAQIDRQCDALSKPDPEICREPDPDDGPTTPLPEP